MISLQVHIVAPIMRWLKILDARDLARPVSLIVRLIQNSRSFADGLVKEGLLSSTILHKLLDKSSQKEVILDVLVIISDLARLSKVRTFSLWHLISVFIKAYVLSQRMRDSFNCRTSMGPFLRQIY